MMWYTIKLIISLLFVGGLGGNREGVAKLPQEADNLIVYGIEASRLHCCQ